MKHQTTHILALAFLIGAFCLLTVPTQAQTTVTPPQDDQQFWNEFWLIKNVTPKQDLVVMGVLRIGRSWTRPVDERIGAGWAFKLNKYLTIMPTYLHVEYQPYAGRVIHEERLVTNVTAKASLGKFTFTDRNLIERRVRPNTPDFTVYRNRLQIDLPWTISKYKLRPFLADEAWYSSQSSAGKDFGWFRNRISAGISKRFSDHLIGDFFLLYQHDGISRPGNIPVFGTYIRYTL